MDQAIPVNPEELELHREIDIARSRVILAARNIVGWYRQGDGVPNMAFKDCEKYVDELDEAMDKFKNPVDKSPI